MNVVAPMIVKAANSFLDICFKFIFFIAKFSPEFLDFDKENNLFLFSFIV